jgi:hypothetical protein
MRYSAALPTLAVLGFGAYCFYVFTQTGDKTKSYGKENIDAYQKQIVQITDTVASGLGVGSNIPKLPPTEYGTWTRTTQLLSDFFIDLALSALAEVKKDEKAAAAYGKRDGSFRFLQEVEAAVANSKSDRYEAALVPVVATFAKSRTLSNSDLWAFSQVAADATGAPRKPYNLT